MPTPFVDLLNFFIKFLIVTFAKSSPKKYAKTHPKRLKKWQFKATKMATQETENKVVKRKRKKSKKKAQQSRKRGRPKMAEKVAEKVEKIVKRAPMPRKPKKSIVSEVELAALVPLSDVQKAICDAYIQSGTTISIPALCEEFGVEEKAFWGWYNNHAVFRSYFSQTFDTNLRNRIEKLNVWAEADPKVAVYMVELMLKHPYIFSGTTNFFESRELFLINEAKTRRKIRDIENEQPQETPYNVLELGAGIVPDASELERISEQPELESEVTDE